MVEKKLGKLLHKVTSRDKVSLLDKIELLMGPPLLPEKDMHSKHADMLLECFFCKLQ